MFMPSGVAAIGKRVELAGGTLIHFVTTGQTATVLEQINSDGKEEQDSAGSGLVSVGNWLLRGSAGDYEVRYDATGDTPAGSAINTWLNCGTTRSWSFVRTANGTSSCSGTLRIRFAGGLELDSVSLDLNATVSP